MRVLEEIAKTSIELLLREPFYAHILGSINKEVVGAAHEVQTMAVGLGSQGTFTLFVNADFWDKELTRPEHRYGVLKHEMLHLVLKHLLLQDPLLDRFLLNVALDLVVNQYVERSQLPDDSIFLESFPELSLQKDQTWYYYYKALENSKGKGGDESKSKTGSESLEQIQSNSNGLERHEPWREIRSRSEMENAVLDTHLDSLLRTAHQRTNAPAWGQLPSYVREQLAGLVLPAQTTLHWRAALRMFAQSARSTRLRSTVRRPSKRYGTTPGIRIDRRQRVLVAIDTSGSVGQREFEHFFAEIRAIWRAGAEVEVVECDTEIHRRYTYKGKTPEWVQGRGGTDFTQPLQLANDTRPDALIYLTDGFAGSVLPAIHVPVMWLISPDGLVPSNPNWAALPGRKVKMAG
jgi:predicted metal-dependent peptidase